MPLPARTDVVVFISISWRKGGGMGALRGAGCRRGPAGCRGRRGPWCGCSSSPVSWWSAARQPNGSQLPAAPERTVVWMLMRSPVIRVWCRRAGPGRCLRPPAAWSACSSEASVSGCAVRVQAAAVARAESGLRGHPPSPSGAPCGSRPLPSPARMCVVVFIAISRCEGSAAGAGTAPGAAAAARAGVAVGAHAGAFAGADVREGVHRLSPCVCRQPSGSIPEPSPA